MRGAQTGCPPAVDGSGDGCGCPQSCVLPGRVPGRRAARSGGAPGGLRAPPLATARAPPRPAAHVPAGTLAPMLGVILAVITANACAVLLGTEGVYESELEAEIRLNYLPQARRMRGCLPASPCLCLPADARMETRQAERPCSRTMPRPDEPVPPPPPPPPLPPPLLPLPHGSTPRRTRPPGLPTWWLSS